jgi:hypothetical protein
MLWEVIITVLLNKNDEEKTMSIYREVMKQGKTKYLAEVQMGSTEAAVKVSNFISCCPLRLEWIASNWPDPNTVIITESSSDYKGAVITEQEVTRIIEWCYHCDGQEPPANYSIEIKTEK